MIGIDTASLAAVLEEDRSADDLGEYFGASHGTHDVAYTGGWFERLAGGGDRPQTAGHIAADDLIAVEMLSVRVPPRVVLDLLHGQLGRQLSGLLALIPTQVPLGSHGAKRHIAPGSPADQAWDLLVARHGVKSVIASKVLARKRPHLLPVYDGVVACALGSPDLAVFWTALHQTLAADGGGLDGRLTQLRATAGLDDISNIRALDVVLWMRHHEAHTERGCPGLT